MSDQWSPVYDVWAVLTSIRSLLCDPNPDSPAFVNVGDKVEKGQTVCIIEAMKIMNQIESEESGVIDQILVENGSPVEYDQPLFVIK